MSEWCEIIFSLYRNLFITVPTLREVAKAFRLPVLAIGSLMQKIRG